ncbi:hypothetical protein PENTCL1PPCAC_16922, partial [Pristionchus entomophagus]
VLFTCIPVCFLVYFEKDHRSRNYRVYELSVLVFSIIAEIWLVMGVPIFLLNHSVVYCAGYVPFGMDSSLYSCIYAAFFFEIANAHTSCMYYRRNVIVNYDTPHRWKKARVLVILRICSFITLIAMYLLVQRIQYPREDASEDLLWLRHYPCVVYIVFNSYVIMLVASLSHT